MLPAAEKVCARPEKEQGSILRNSVTFWETADAEENLSFSSRQKSVRPRTQTHIKIRVPYLSDTGIGIF